MYGVVSSSHPDRVDLRAVLEKVPDHVLIFQPSVSQITDFSQSVEGAVGLYTHIKNMTKMINWMIPQGQNCHICLFMLIILFNVTIFVAKVTELFFFYPLSFLLVPTYNELWTYCISSYYIHKVYKRTVVMKMIYTL